MSESERFTPPSAADEARRLSEALINGTVSTNAALREAIGDDVVAEAEGQALLLAQTAATVADDPELQRPAFGFGGFADLDLPEDEEHAPPQVTFTDVLEDVSLFGDPVPEQSSEDIERSTFSGTVAPESGAEVDYAALADPVDPPDEDEDEDSEPLFGLDDDLPEDDDDEFTGLDREGFDALGDDPLSGTGLIDGDDYLSDMDDGYPDEPAADTEEPLRFAPPVPTLPGGVGGTPTVDTTAELNPPIPPDFFGDSGDVVLEKDDRGPSLFSRITGFFTGLWKKFTRLSRRIQIIAVAVLVTILLVLIFGMTGTGERKNATPPPVVPITQPTPEEDEYAALIPAKVSSKCAEPSTSPKEAFSTQEGAAWVCQRSHGIDGGVMNIVFSKPVIVSEIRLLPGYNRVQSNGKDEWNLHRVITRIKWRAGGKTYIQQIVPSRSVAIFKFPQPVTTNSMALIIQQSVGPDQTVGDAGSGSSSPLGAGKVSDATAVMSMKIIGKEA